MVQVLLNLNGQRLDEDAADALAVALCHEHGRRLRVGARELTDKSRSRIMAQLTGILATKAIDQIVLDVHGVGYRVSIPLSTYYELPQLNAPISFVYSHLRAGRYFFSSLAF